MEIITYAAAHELTFKLGGFFLAVVGFVVFLMFPVRHKDTTTLGDGGLGLFVTSIRQYGLLRTLLVYAPMAFGAALYFLPSLGGYN